MPDTAPFLSPDDRGTEILLSIRATFAEKGFNGASMQDLARAAGISVGSFYRYFPSKAAIVDALVSLDIAEIDAAMEVIKAAPDPRAAVRAALSDRVREDRGIDNCLWAEITAAALRTSDVAGTCRRMEETIATKLTQIFALISGLSPEVCAERYGAHARYLILMVKAAASRSDQSPDPALDDMILRGLDRVLDEIPSRPAAG